MKLIDYTTDKAVNAFRLHSSAQKEVINEEGAK